LALATVASSGVVLAACEMISGLSRTTQVDGDGATTPITEAGPEDGGLGLACTPRLPEVPVSQVGSDLGRLSFAVHFVGEGTTTTPKDAGLVEGDRTRLCPRADIDLDGLETCAKLPDGGRVGPSCLSLTSTPACDTAGGGDNVGGNMVRLLLGDTPSSRNDPNAGFRDGTAGILIELSGYNGLDDDGDVRVAAIFAIGVDDGTGKPGGTPKWDGTDTWIPERNSFVNDDLPTYVADSAFVSGGLLVARFRKTPIPLGGTTRVSAEEIIFTARVVRDGSPPLPRRLDYGRIAARVAIDSAFAYLGGRLSNGVPFCEPPNRQPITLAVCGIADLSKTPGMVDPTKPCDAFSYASGFYAEIAQRSARRSDQTIDASLPSHCPADASWPPSCSEAL